VLADGRPGSTADASDDAFPSKLIKAVSLVTSTVLPIFEVVFA
jgi:hypothetical protein